MQIRQAKPGDIDYFIHYAYALRKQHHAFNPDRFSTFLDHERSVREYLLRQLENTEAVVLLLEMEEKIVGYAFVRMEEESLTNISSRRAWIHDIFIDESVRGQKAGKLLWSAAVEAAKALGSPVVMLGVAEENVYARLFFAREGFKTATREMMIVFT